MEKVVPGSNWNEDDSHVSNDGQEWTIIDRLSETKLKLKNNRTGKKEVFLIDEKGKLKKESTQ